ncbi:hypothetical protein FXO38_00063 [Capsicum annuum]|nr:hypothetical protein FXO38_00063 [Capsicum annuum]KAF3685983.1 hypothetical protein FXO37_00074 [Capsicum annuum]
MGYVPMENEWCEKESAHGKAEPLKVSKSVSNPFVSLMKEFEEFKQRFKTIEKGIMQLQESTATLLVLRKTMKSEIGVVQLGLNGLKKGVKQFSRVHSRMYSLKS